MASVASGGEAGSSHEPEMPIVANPGEGSTQEAVNQMFDSGFLLSGQKKTGVASIRDELRNLWWPAEAISVDCLWQDSPSVFYPEYCSTLCFTRGAWSKNGQTFFLEQGQLEVELALVYTPDGKLALSFGGIIPAGLACAYTENQQELKPNENICFHSGRCRYRWLVDGLRDLELVGRYGGRKTRAVASMVLEGGTPLQDAFVMPKVHRTTGTLRYAVESIRARGVGSCFGLAQLLANGDAPPVQEQDGPAIFQRGWQQHAGQTIHRQQHAEFLAQLDPAGQAMIASQTGPFASRTFTTIPYGPDTTYPSHLFRSLLLRRLRLPLPLAERSCRRRSSKGHNSPSTPHWSPHFPVRVSPGGEGVSLPGLPWPKLDSTKNGHTPNCSSQVAAALSFSP